MVNADLIRLDRNGTNLSSVMTNSLPFKGGLGWGWGKCGKRTHPHPGLPLEGEGMKFFPLFGGGGMCVNPCGIRYFCHHSHAPAWECSRAAPEARDAERPTEASQRRLWERCKAAHSCPNQILFNTPQENPQHSPAPARTWATALPVLPCRPPCPPVPFLRTAHPVPARPPNGPKI